MENINETASVDKKQKLTPKQRWNIIADFIRKTDAAELVIIKTMSHEPSDDISIESFDPLTAMAINTALNCDADPDDIEDAADMVAHRVGNAYSLSRKLAKTVSGKQHSMIEQVLMNAAKSKRLAKESLAQLRGK